MVKVKYQIAHAEMWQFKVLQINCNISVQSLCCHQGRNWLVLIGKHRALQTHVIGGSEWFSMVILRNFEARRYAQCLCADRQLRHWPWCNVLPVAMV